MLNMSQENSNTIDKMDMSKKITRLYLYGAIISLILVVFIIVFARENYKSIIFPMAAFGSYIGVIWGGITNPESWGKTNNMIKASALVAFYSLFFVPFLTSIFFLLFHPGVSGSLFLTIIFIEIGVLAILGVFLYFVWFKHLYLNPLKGVSKLK